ncbi:hypothetical protein NQ314_019887 [Rhamnusium bicolor]|uniref:C2H2-type domain-containing protein n=1 Tax=Rhamnusium bicolor TaxID=1586634 RepID=A0AAV8WPH6_9CUCU|nr:hypothetical protein NQ314_019887 [Rhamnusium bicolor]
MQSSPDLTCTDCNNEFKSAALLLQHFANHAVKHLETETILPKTELINGKTEIPNLYPINKKNNISDTDRGSDSGFEDVNPLKFCLVTMEDKMHAQELVRDITENKNRANPTLRKYQCMYCSKRFGWSTDLKRHILIHTGERPFQCQFCNSSFTRNFLLQKHQRKLHFSDRVNVNLPELKPIGEVMNNKKSRKQQKFQIKRKSSSLDECQNNYLEYKLNSLLCSS